MTSTNRATILDGKAIAAEVTAEVAAETDASGLRPGLAVVLVGDDPASAVYVRNKTRSAERVGFYHVQHTLPADTSEAELIQLIDRLNADDRVDGILVQLPLPGHIGKERVLDRVLPQKDVDGFHPMNAGLLTWRRPCLVPCTPAGVMELLRRTGQNLRGEEAVIVGRSNIVGKPMIQLLEQADCTVTLAHSRTRDLATVVGRASVVVAAVGVPELVKGAWIRDGARVIDVGINRAPSGRLVGDVEFAAAAERAAFITPVPGGVGPMTIAMLMRNTLTAAKRRLP